MNTTEKLLKEINETTELKDYQKEAMITAISEKKIKPEKFLESFYPATLRQLFVGAEFFPRTVLEYLLIQLVDAGLENKIISLSTETKFHSLILDYFEKCKATPEKKYSHVSDIITQLWSDSEKDPSIFKNSMKFEPVLQSLPNYRDHFIHSFYVFILGYYILNKLDELLGRDFKSFFRSNDPNLTWMLASTFHDIAYPIERIELWLGNLLDSFIGISPKNFFNYENVFPNIYYDFMKMISSYHRSNLNAFSAGNVNSSMDWSFYNELNSKFLEKDHGVLSGLILAHQLAIRDGFIKTGQEWTFFINHLPASHAICSHTLNYKIDFAKYPIAFLLVLCDEIQDWGRPTKQ